MIERYQTKEMKSVWTDENKFQNWLRVELAVLQVYAANGLIPKADYDKIVKNAAINPKRIAELEEVLHHDVIAFTRQLSETLGPESKWIHFGLTSTDVVDTAGALMIKQANDLIETALNRFIGVLKSLAQKYENTPCIGRTHGIHAEITSFGLKWALYYDEAKRNLRRFHQARAEIETGKISGAVGNFANLDPEVETKACAALGINRADISTQVLSRDRHANYVCVLGLIASLIEKIATEVRNLSRTEIREVEEFFDQTQKGSSAMPHKRNPITSENMCGCSRIVRSYVNVAFENNVLWHERDISHSSAERIMIADATSLIQYMLVRYAKTLETLQVHPDRMLGNIQLTKGLVFSGRIVSMLIEKGLTREESYDFTQKAALVCDQTNQTFSESLQEAGIGQWLSAAELESCFSREYYLKNVHVIYERLNLGD
jgi:adenylosuccinate lyase